MRTFLCFAVLAAGAAFGQPAGTPPRFEAADVHRNTAVGAQVVRGPFMTGARYDLHNATMVDLIVKAYGVTADKVLDGPTWLEFDRFDISAAVPPKTSAADARLMLQTLLADRFDLALHKEDRPLPAYVLTAPKGKQKMKEAGGSGEPGCKMTLDQPRAADPAAGVPNAIIAAYTCRSMTMEAFTAGLNGMLLAQQYIGPNPVQDKTGLEGKWDFNFKYSLPLGGSAPGDGTTLPDALDKQVGLKLEQETVTLPVMVVEKANHVPSPNAPDVAQKIPAFPAEFDVATIKPFAPPTGGGPMMFGVQTQPGGRVRISALPLKQLVQQAWGVGSDSIIGAPKWMDTDRYDIVAKMPENGALPTPSAPVDVDAVNVMLRALLIDRFQIAAHMEERPVTAYTLTAPKPKLKKADAATRTKWIESSGPISLNGSSVPSRTIKFQNMSMAQLAEKLSYVGAAYIRTPVADGTGLEGGYDFTLTFSPIAPAQLATLLARPADAGGANDPIGGVSLFEAIDKQLGLKLVEQRRPMSVLVIDHIAEKPSDN